MVTKKKVKAPAKKNAKTISVTLETGQSEENKFAKKMLSPHIMNTATVQALIKPIGGEIDLKESILIMPEKVEKINDGDLSELEATLTAQVVSLNSLFTAVAIRSSNNMGHDLKIVEVYMRLALKAQAQCARTIEVITTVKNGCVTINC